MTESCTRSPETSLMGPRIARMMKAYNRREGAMEAPHDRSREIANRSRGMEDFAATVRTLGAVLGVVAALSCAEGEAEPGELGYAATDSAGIQVIRLSDALDFRSPQQSVSMLAADLTLGGDSSTFGHIADIAGFADGRFAVLDRMNADVTVFSREGREIRRFGRKGNGAGEFANPIAIVTFGGRFVVRDSRRRTPLLVFDTTGAFLASPTQTIKGDWNTHLIRLVIPRTTDAPFRMPLEDLTLRLLPLSNGTFAYVLQTEQILPPSAELAASTAFLIRFDSAAVAGDTIDRDLAPVDAPMPTAPDRYLEQALYVGRPVWATGDSWIAHGHGDSAHITVVNKELAPIALVELSPARSRISESDQRIFADWFYREDVLKHGPEAQATQVKALMGTPAIEPYTNQIVKAMHFAQLAPTITSMHGDGACLWVAGFNPEDYPTGTSLTWLGINVRSGRVAVYRFPRRGARVRDFAGGFAYTTYQDDDGLHWLERYKANCE